MSNTKTTKKKQRFGFIGTVSSFISVFLTTIVSAFALIFLASFFLNISMYTVKTGSMEPTYHVNSIVFVKSVDFSELQVGDAVTYVKDEQGNLVTHRIVSIDATEKTVVTKGDANASTDANPILAGNIIGKVIFNFPAFGGVIEYITDQGNRLTVLGVLAAFGLLSFILDKLEKKFSTEDEDDKSEEQTTDADEIKKPDDPEPERIITPQPELPKVRIEAEAELTAHRETENEAISSGAAFIEWLTADEDSESASADIRVKQRIGRLDTLAAAMPKWENLSYKLVDILFLGLTSAICGGRDFEHMEDTAHEKLEWFKDRLGLSDNVPGSDVFRRVFELIDPDALSDIMQEIAETGDCNAQPNPYNSVHVWVSENQLVLGQLTAEGESDEASSIINTLDLIQVSGCTVFIDALRNRKALTGKICAGKADYVLSLNENDKSIITAVKPSFESEQSEYIVETNEKGSGRIEKREFYLITSSDALTGISDFEQIKGIGMLKTTVTDENIGRITEGCRYFATSLTDVNAFSDAVKKHRSVDGLLRWQLDITGTADSLRAKKDNSYLNLNVLQREAAFMLDSADFGKHMSLRRKIACTAMNSDYLELVFSKNKRA